jgi:hypothetical protein
MSAHALNSNQPYFETWKPYFVCISTYIIRAAYNDKFKQLALICRTRHVLESKLNKDTEWAGRDFM